MPWCGGARCSAGRGALPGRPGHFGPSRPDSRPGPRFLGSCSFGFPSHPLRVQGWRKTCHKHRISFKYRFGVKNSCVFYLLSCNIFMFILMYNVLQYLPVSKTDMHRSCAPLSRIFLCEKESQGPSLPPLPPPPQPGWNPRWEKIPKSKPRAFTTRMSQGHYAK